MGFFRHARSDMAIGMIIAHQRRDSESFHLGIGGGGSG
jgi:hypothetical protein